MKDAQEFYDKNPPDPASAAAKRDELRQIKAEIAQNRKVHANYLKRQEENQSKPRDQGNYDR